MKFLKQAFIITLLIGLVSSCTTVSRGIGNLMDNKYAKPRSGSVWVVAPPQLEPPAGNDRTVYISYRNISDADIDLLQEMRSAAQQQGWTIVNDPSQAKYRLRASLRFFGEVEPESGGAAKAAGMGLIAGAAVGVGTYKLTGSGAGGAVAGIAAGGLVAAGLANGSKPREWALIVDIVLEEYTSKAVEFTLSTGSSSGMVSGAGAGNNRMGVGGGESSGNTTDASMTKRSNYYPHGIRLSVWSNQMNMKEEESLPHILKRTKKVITQLLPM